MRQQPYGSIKVYGVFTWSDVVICVKPMETCMKNSESKKRLLALQKSKFLFVEIQDALRFAIENLCYLLLEYQLTSKKFYVWQQIY